MADAHHPPPGALSTATTGTAPGPKSREATAPEPATRLSLKQWIGLTVAAGVLFLLLTADILLRGVVWHVDDAVGAWVLSNLSPQARHLWFEVVLSAGGGTPVVQVAGVAIAVAIAVRRWVWGLVYLGAMVGSQWTMAGIKILVGRARPDAGLLVTNSFPSGHATAATVAYMLGALLVVRVYDRPRRWAAWAIYIAALLVALTGLGRILAGVHYPGDVLGGFLLGGFVTGGVMCAWKAGVRRTRAAGELARPGAAPPRELGEPPASAP